MSTSNAKIISHGSELYTRHIEYLPENTLNVNKLEDEEQRRRIADKEGENNKRVVANNLAVMFGENTRVTWFQLGSTFVLDLVGSVGLAVKSQASHLSSAVASKAGVAKQSAQEVAVNIKNKGVEGAHNIALGLQDKSAKTAHDISSFAQEKTQNLSSFAQEKTHNLSSFAQEKTHDISSFAQGKAIETKSLVANKVGEYSHKLKDAVSASFYKSLGSFVSFGGHYNQTFALMQLEVERSRRMNSAEEIFAIKNAMKVASLIKDLPALYRPSSEPYALYSAKLLEEAERVRRIVQLENNDKTALTNAKAVSALINEKFNVQTKPILLEKKVEQVNNEPQVKSAYTAAM